MEGRVFLNYSHTFFRYGVAIGNGCCDGHFSVLISQIANHLPFCPNHRGPKPQRTQTTEGPNHVGSQLPSQI